MNTFLVGIANFSWSDLFIPHISWLEKLGRPFMVYLFLAICLRLSRKREIAQATMFDFLVILLISNVVQNAIIGNDNSILGAFAGSIVLLALSYSFDRLTATSKKARIFLEGKPVLLIKNGAFEHRKMEKWGVSKNDLLCAVRKQGMICTFDVAYGILEVDGSISIIKKGETSGDPDCLPEFG